MVGGGVLAGGLVGYLVGSNGGLFGNNNNNKNGTQDKLEDIMDGQNTKAILDATINGDSAIRSDLTALTKDVYSLNIQQLINDQNNQRNLDNQFCKTREFITADGNATRASINAFETRYLEDRIHDRDLTIAKLQNELIAAPLTCGLAAVNSKLDSVIGCAGVRICNDKCYNNNPYTIPPLVRYSNKYGVI